MNPWYFVYLQLFLIGMALGKNGVRWLLGVAVLACLCHPEFRSMLKGLWELRNYERESQALKGDTDEDVRDGGRNLRP